MHLKSESWPQWNVACEFSKLEERIFEKGMRNVRHELAQGNGSLRGSSTMMELGVTHTNESTCVCVHFTLELLQVILTKSYPSRNSEERDVSAAEASTQCAFSGANFPIRNCEIHMS